MLASIHYRMTGTSAPWECPPEAKGYPKLHLLGGMATRAEGTRSSRQDSQGLLVPESASILYFRIYNCGASPLGTPCAVGRAVFAVPRESVHNRKSLPGR